MKKKLLVVSFAIILIAINSIAQEKGEFTDLRDGNTYKTVKIGNQIWMAENLRYNIPSANPNYKSHFAYDDNIENVPQYGYLYDWNDACKVCPAGWYLPSIIDWEILLNSANEIKGPFNVKQKNKMSYQAEWFDIGNFLKDSTGWDSLGNGNNYFGFNGLPGGTRCKYYKTGYKYFGQIGWWWTSTKVGQNIYDAQLTFSSSNFFISNVQTDYNMSVRCIKGWSKENDGMKNKSVVIGNQEWMVENLNISVFCNGDPIPEVKSIGEWQYALKNKLPAYCYYNFDAGNGNNYGKIYNWYAVIDPRGIAPLGWHVPSDKEWEQLINYLGGNKIAGKKMKSKTGWELKSIFTKKVIINGNGTNESGFSAFPGGFLVSEKSLDSPYSFGKLIYNSLTFYGIDTDGYWWCSTESNAKKSWGFSININPSMIKNEIIHNKDNYLIYDRSSSDDPIYKNAFDKGCGFYVRCIKD